ncbi:hypothetical protein C8J57DRAFT_1227213 [Mycena rebaudengoi]|nr:hypothetical protein C8J57DRAFT_1227213 [Mycena rebaudengoi]
MEVNDRLRPTMHLSSGLQHIFSSVRCVGLYLACLARINSLALNHRYSNSDTAPFVAFGVRSFGLQEFVAHGLWGGAQLIARFIHCAAHGIDPNGTRAQFVPAHIPIENLREVGLPMPNISLVLSYPENPFLRRRFHSRLDVIRAAELFADWVNYWVFWLGECIRRSISMGGASSWKFGLVLGTGTAGFLAKVAGAGAPADLAPGQDWKTEETFMSDARDMEIARIIRPAFTHLGVMEGPTQIGVALHPVEYPIAGPMDAIMDNGFQKMELDYAAMGYAGRSGVF